MTIPVIPIRVTQLTRVETIENHHVGTSFIKALELFENKKEILGVEIGIWEGVNAKLMLLNCAKLKLILVDNWTNVVVYTGGVVQEQAYRDLIKSCALLNLYGYKDRAKYTFKNSLESVESFPDESMDYIYIDGDHEHEPVLRDLRIWYPKVKTGGILGGHDVRMTGVSNALDIFIKENNIPNDRWGKEGDIKQEGSDFWIYK